MKRASSIRQAFTLIEIMLVVAIMALVMMIGYPAISDMVHRGPLAQAVRDVMEGCRKARALAILQGRPMELQIYPQDGRLNVAPAPVDVDTSAAAASARAGAVAAPGAPAVAAPKSAGGFSAQISGEVRLELLDVNFTEYKEQDMARVRFYPNGTSDEFTMIMAQGGEYRKITLEVVTGLASMDTKIK
jgi:prepilin-type N-terminal cleavage/methylation domain-containing protein